MNPLLQAVPTEVSSAISSGFADVQTLLTGTMIPLIFGLVLIVIAIALGIRWLRRVTGR